MRRRRFTESAALAEVKARQFVSWAGSKGDSKGRVKSVHKGKVPAVPVKVEGSDLDPAARVEMYAKQDGGWVPTGMYVGIPASKLTGIDDLPEPSTTEALVQGSFDDLRRRVQAAIEDNLEAWADRAGLDTEVYVWVMDIGPDWAVYCCGCDDDTFKVTYTVDAEGAVSLGDPVEVQAQTDYVPVEPPIDAPTGEVVTEAVRKQADRVVGKLIEAKGSDGDGGRIFGVRIIAAGDSKNGRRYTPPVLTAAAPKYEGAKAFDHHRTESELRSSTIDGLVGYYRDVQAQPDGLYADLHLLPSARHTAEALDASLAAQEAGLEPLVGISHDVYAEYRQVVESGRNLQEATQILSVNSADVVADPAAGGRATRMVAGGITATEGKDHTVDEAELLAALQSLSPEQRDQLGITYAPPSEGAGSEATESTEPMLLRDGIFGGLAIEQALKAEKMPTGLLEAVRPMLPTSFTEAALPGHVARVKDVFAKIEAANLGPRVTALGEGVTSDERDKKVKAVEATFNGDYANGFRSIKQMWAAFTDTRPQAFDTEDDNRRILAECFGSGFDSQRRSTESVTSGTFSTILGDAITRRMVAEYQQPDLQTWRAVVSAMPPINDFRTQRIERMGGYGTLPGVNEGAPYQPLTTPGNEESTYALSKRGGTEDITIETIANDDLRAVQRIPTKLGLAAAQTLYRYVWDMLANNITCTFDTTALFAAGHNNVDAGNTLSQTNLSAGRKKMRKQSAYGDTTDILSIVPKYLVVPADLEELAFQLCTSAVAIPATPAGPTNTPNIHQGLQPIVVDYYSATATWFLVADPNTVPTIELGFYQGRQDPDLFTQSDAQVGSVFTSDKITYKIRHIYAGTPLEFRGFYRGN